MQLDSRLGVLIHERSDAAGLCSRQKMADHAARREDQRILGVGLFGGIFGMLGLVLSGPLLAASYVAVKKLWIREALDEDTRLPTDSP